MRINQELTRLGHFWLPSAPERRIAGTLSMIDGGHIQLEASGRFDEYSPSIERIVGEIEKEGFVTLDDCYYKKGTVRVIGGPSKSFIHVTRAFIRVHYDEGERPVFNALTFSVEGIDEWVGISGINVEHIEQRTATISYELPADISLILHNGIQLLISFKWTPPSFPIITEAKINQKTYFKLISQTERELDELISIVHKITTFLCFAMDQTVSLDSMSATSDNIRRDIGEGKTGMIPIDIYYSSWPYSKDVPKINRGRLFEFQEIQNDAEIIINNWIKAYEKIAPSFNLYFWAKMGMQTYLEERFMALVQGLEALHRRTSNEKRMDEAKFDELLKNLIDRCPDGQKEWLGTTLKYGNEVSLRKRLKDIIEPFKDVIGNRTKPKILINRIVNSRNYLTHYDLSLESEAAKGEELWTICLKMELLFQLHFLHLIGFSREQIDSIVANCPQIRWKLRE